MKRFLVTSLLFCLTVISMAHAQNGKYQNIAIGVNAAGVLVPIRNATITVFNSGNPPTIASLCISLSDLTCTASNVLSGDISGNFSFYAKPGTYVVQVVGSGFATYTYNDVIVNSVSSVGIPLGISGQVPVMNSVNTAYAPQAKPMIDVRDISGVDCTGATDSAAALTAFTGNPPTTNSVLNQKTLSFGRCLQIKLASTWVIYNQAGFIIDGLTRSGSGSQGVNVSWAGAANGVMIDMEYVDGFQVQGLNIQGNSTAGVGIQVDKNGAGGVWNTSDGKFVNDTFQGANQNWIGLSISPVSGSNVEDMRIEDSTFYCNALRATTNGTGIMIGASANAKNEIIKHANIVQCFYGIWQKSGSMQVRDSEFSANGGTCGSGTGSDIRIDASTDVDIIEGNLDENSTQGINQNNDNLSQNPGHPIIVRGNHGAPAGCENTSVFWYNTGRGATPWIFEGDSWDHDSSLVKVIGSGSTGANGTIYTRGMLYPNSIFSPWWTNYTTAIADDLAIGANFLRVSPAVTGTVPSASTELQSPYEVFRGYINGSTATPDDFAIQNIPSGTVGTTGGTFLIKHQQGATGTEMFGWDGSYPGITLATIPTPSITGISQGGTSGSTSYTYAVVAYGSTGNTPASSTLNTTTGNAALSSTNFNQIAWNPVSGATKYCVWRTVGGGSTGNIGCTSALSIPTSPMAFGYTVNASGVSVAYLFNDTGLAGDSASLPTLNSTGGVQLTSFVFANLPASNNGTMLYCSDCKNVTDDTTGTFDSAAASGGHGTNVLRENGAWRVH